jgi:hypothetical protein
MSEARITSRPSWGVVVLTAAIAALAAAAIIVRTSPPATGSTSAASERAVDAVDRVKLSVGEQATLFRNDARRHLHRRGRRDRDGRVRGAGP